MWSAITGSSCRCVSYRSLDSCLSSLHRCHIRLLAVRFARKMDWPDLPYVFLVWLLFLFYLSFFFQTRCLQSPVTPRGHRYASCRRSDAQTHFRFRQMCIVSPPLSTPSATSLVTLRASRNSPKLINATLSLSSFNKNCFIKFQLLIRECR